ncbi:MAG: 50S ribosomal protein L11 methyltransferase [Bryobacteraceae bacterium]
MYSLRLTCPREDAEMAAAELWEAGTAGIQEIAHAGSTVLIAAFETNSLRNELLLRFARFLPDWQLADATDWIAHTHNAWPARPIGERLFLVPPWSQEETPPGRVRIVHNPGSACGTGEHPCTQLALSAIEQYLEPGARVADIGTGSGILAIAALSLGARQAIGVDIDRAALEAARENFSLNQLESPLLVAGSTNCLSDDVAGLTVANINPEILCSLIDDLVRMTHPGGWLILTGFTEAEMPRIEQLLPNACITGIGPWRCACARRNTVHLTQGHVAPLEFRNFETEPGA